MSIKFDLKRQERLLYEYGNVLLTITNALDDLEAQLDKAHQLLPENTKAQTALLELVEVAHEVRADRGDLAARGDFLKAADARTALLLSVRAGQLINPTLAATALEEGWAYEEALLHQQLELLHGRSQPHSTKTELQIVSLERELARWARPFTAAGLVGDGDSDLSDVRIGRPLRLDLSLIHI